ncbi:hypothetical protein ACHAQA_009116 [Verticillium albo-atrum]
MPKDTGRSVRKASSSSTPEPAPPEAVKSGSHSTSSSSRQSSTHSSKKTSQVLGTCATIPGRSPPVNSTAEAVEPSIGSSIKSRANTPEDSALVAACIAHRKKQIVDNLMAIILEWIDKSLGLDDEACDGESPGPSNSSGSGSKGGRPRGSYPSLAGQKRQLQRSDDEGPPDDNDDDKNGKDRNNKREHLFRKHRLPTLRCKRCYECFNDDAALEDHVRLEISCPLRDEHKLDPVEGFDADKEAKLRARLSPKKTEAKHWSDMYCMLFELPEGASEIPSPYHHPAMAGRLPDSDKSRTEVDEGFKKYCRQQLPIVIRREVEDEVDRECLGVADHMRGKIVDIIESVQLRLWANYSSIRSPEEAASMGDPNVPASPLHDPHPQLSRVAPALLSTDDIDSFERWTLLNEVTEACGNWEMNTLFGAGGQPPSLCCDHHPFCDSAYCSNVSVSTASGRQPQYGPTE